MSAQLLYDAECGFCTKAARFLQRIGGPVAVMPLQEADLASHGVTYAAAKERIHLVQDSGPTLTGAEAILTSLARSRRPGWQAVGKVGLAVPSRVSEPAYDWVAAHRSQIPTTLPGRRKAAS